MARGRNKGSPPWRSSYPSKTNNAPRLHSQGPVQSPSFQPEAAQPARSLALAGGCWLLSRQPRLSTPDIGQGSSRRDGTYLMGGQKCPLLPYAANCRGAVHAKPGSGRCQKQYKYKCKKSRFSQIRWRWRSCATSSSEWRIAGIFLARTAPSTERSEVLICERRKGFKKKMSDLHKHQV